MSGKLLPWFDPTHTEKLRAKGVGDPVITLMQSIAPEESTHQQILNGINKAKSDLQSVLIYFKEWSD